MEELSMQPDNYNLLFEALSEPRIGAYKNYFGNSLTDAQLFGCYQWNESISLTFFKLITIIEIVMRNRMHEALSSHYFNHTKKIVNNTRTSNSKWTYDLHTTQGHQQSCNWYNAVDSASNSILNSLSLSKIHSKTHNSRGKAIAANRAPSPDDIVSSLSFGFWSSLVDKCPDLNWDNLLVSIFPKHRTSNSNQWNSPIEQKKLSYRLDLIRDFRNRIAHHEPIWKFSELLSEQPPLRNGQIVTGTPRPILDQASTTPQNSIRRLRNIYNKHLEFLKWMSKDIHDDIKASSLHTHLLWLCSDQGLEAHLDRNTLTSTSMKTSQFKRELQSILRGKKKAFLHKGGRNVLAIQHIS